MYTTNSSLFLLFKLLLLLLLDSANLITSSSCLTRKCGEVEIPFPFGMGENCYLDKPYEIECRNTTSSRKPVPFLSVIGKEFVSVSFASVGEIDSNYNPVGSAYLLRYGSVSVKWPITSAGCLSDGKEESAEPIMNLTGSPYFIDDANVLVAVGCNSKVSLTNIEPKIVGCELRCNTSKNSHSSTTPFFNEAECPNNVLSYRYKLCTEDIPEEERECINGNGCCEATLPMEPLQVIGIKIESTGGNTMKRDNCRVAFITDQVYPLSDATKPEQIFSKGFATLTLGWVIKTKNNSFLDSLECKNITEYHSATPLARQEMKCLCETSTISGISYAQCGCIGGFRGDNAYISGGCVDVDECKEKLDNCKKGETCENLMGGYRCKGNKTKPILIGVGSGFGVLVLVGGVWWLRKFLIKRRIKKRKEKFFKRNGGLLLQQELDTRVKNHSRKINHLTPLTKTLICFECGNKHKQRIHERIVDPEFTSRCVRATLWGRKTVLQPIHYESKRLHMMFQWR